MKVKATQNLGHGDYPTLFPFLEGETKDVSTDLGTLIVARGHGVLVAEEPEPATETPKPIAVAKAVAEPTPISAAVAVPAPNPPAGKSQSRRADNPQGKQS